MARVLFENVRNPFVRSFLLDNLGEFVSDVHTYSSDIFANLSAERKPFVKSAGLAFLSAPIVSLAPELPWHKIRTAIDTAIRKTLPAAAGDNDCSAEGDTGNSGDSDDLIERAITTAFVSACASANGHTGAILVGGLADLLGKYIALHVAGALDEAQFRPPVQVRSDNVVSKPPEKSGRTAGYYSPCNAQPYIEKC